MWPSMVTHTRNLSSAFNPSKCTLTAVNTHPEQWAAYCGARGAVGDRALLKHPLPPDMEVKTKKCVCGGGYIHKCVGYIYLVLVQVLDTWEVSRLLKATVALRDHFPAVKVAYTYHFIVDVAYT